MSCARPRKRWLQSRQPAVEPRFHRGKRRPGNAGNLFESELLVEAKDNYLAMQPIELSKSSVYTLTVLHSRQRLKGARMAVRNLEWPLAFAFLLEGFKARSGPFAGVVDHQV